MGKNAKGEEGKIIWGWCKSKKGEWRVTDVVGGGELREMGARKSCSVKVSVCFCVFFFVAASPPP